MDDKEIRSKDKNRSHLFEAAMSVIEVNAKSGQNEIRGLEENIEYG